MVTIIQCVKMTKEKTRYKYGDYIIRPIKGRYYVYKLETINGEIKETYVGSLVDVVETYMKLKKSGVGGALPPLWARGDLNPGSLPCEGKESDFERRKIALVTNLRQYASDGNTKAFYDWLLNKRKVSEAKAKSYISAITKGYTDSDNSRKAYRLFAKFLAEEGIISEDFRDKILSVVKVKPSNPDLYVPTLEEVKMTLSLAKEYSENVYLVYRLALESGARLSEILKALSEPEKDICEKDICYYPMSWTRGYKGSYYIFHITPLKRVNITRHAIHSFEKRHEDAIAIKYFRKFVSTQMASLGVPFDIIDFIQGRKPTRVLTQHYVQLFGIAKEQYKKYAEWLRKTYPV